MTMGDQVYYIPNQSVGRKSSNIFTWLGIAPKLLQRRPSVNSGNVILYVQWGYSIVNDDIAEVRRSLPDYPQVTDASTIYILAMSKHDNADIHIHGCVQAEMKTEGNITFYDIHCSHNGEIYDCRGNNTNKNFLLGNKQLMESVAQASKLEHVKQEQTMSDCVYYILKERKAENLSNLFAWLGMSPELLQKSPEVDSGNDVILYIQRGYSIVHDDITEVRRILTDYPEVTDTSRIYILAMSTYDDAKEHIRNCVHAMTRTEGNIIFLETHCSESGKIHNCKGNNDSKSILRSKLKLVEQDVNQTEGSIETDTKIGDGTALKVLLAIGVLTGFAVLIFKHR